MTVLFLSRIFYPHIGGVEKHVLEIGKRLVKFGHKVVVLTEDYYDPYQPRGNSAKLVGEVFGIRIHRLRLGGEDWFKKLRTWIAIWRERDLIQKSDVVHCHDVFFWYLPFRFFYSKKPVFTTFHGFETKFPPSKNAILLRKLSELLSFGNICVGDYIKKWYGTEPTYVTYGAIDVTNSRPKDDRPLAEKLKILLVGRLEEDIGAPIYLKALELLRKKGLKIELEACGDGSFRKDFEEFGKVHGFVKDLKPYIEKSDLIFASSYLSVLEALAFKKPVFSVYDNPLKKDYLKMAPFAKWIVIKSSPDSLAKEIQEFLKDPKQRTLLTNRAFAWVKDQTWEKAVSQYLNLWKI